MKKLALIVSLLLAAGVASAQGTATQTDKSQAAAGASKAKTHPVKAEFVSADMTQKTLTLKTETGESTVPMEGKALTSVKQLKAGQKVIVICKDDAEGNHQAAIEVKAVPAKAAPKSN